jgi:hypothetical protein
VVSIVRVVKIGAEGDGPAADVMEINRLGDLAITPPWATDHAREG